MTIPLSMMDFGVHWYGIRKKEKKVQILITSIAALTSAKRLSKYMIFFKEYHG